nr:uncharacterized protein LOC111982945 [Quercus suber]
MNILVWNCRGAMKPLFRKTVLDLVEQHSPFLMVITETRLSEGKAEEIIECLPFDGAAVADTIGFAGGIWLLWRSDLVQVDVLVSTKQEIHALIRVKSQTFSWLLSAIYANPRFLERCILWDNLKMLASLHNLSWALMGDFNEVLNEEEKSGGNSMSHRRVGAIRDCMNVCHILDLGFSGPKFTWTNKREFGNLIQCRLDRPFRFQSIWLSHTEFPMVVRDAWAGQDDNLPMAISGFTLKVQKWNKEVFGNVYAKKRQIMARFLSTQKALANHPTPFLVDL